MIKKIIQTTCIRLCKMLKKNMNNKIYIGNNEFYSIYVKNMKQSPHRQIVFINSTSLTF